MMWTPEHGWQERKPTANETAELKARLTGLIPSHATDVRYDVSMSAVSFMVGGTRRVERLAVSDAS